VIVVVMDSPLIPFLALVARKTASATWYADSSPLSTRATARPHPACAMAEPESVQLGTVEKL